MKKWANFIWWMPKVLIVVGLMGMLYCFCQLQYIQGQIDMLDEIKEIRIKPADVVEKELGR